MQLTVINAAAALTAVAIGSYMMVQSLLRWSLAGNRFLHL